MLVGGFKNTTYNQYELREATLAATSVYYKSNLLLEAEAAGLPANLQLPEAVRWTSVTNETWWAGHHYPGWQEAAENALAYFFTPPLGTPMGEASNLTSLETRGDFRLFDWGSMLTVMEDDEQGQPFRTGIWTEDEVVLPTGFVVQRKTHAQLARLEARNATFILTMSGGDAHWATITAKTETSKTLAFKEARVELTSLRHMYDGVRPQLLVSGAVNASLEAVSEGTGLVATIQAHNASLNMAPTSTRVPPPSGISHVARANPPADMAASDSRIRSLSSRETFPWYLGAAGVAGFGCFALVARKVRVRREVNRLVALAEDALMRGQAGEGETFASRALEFEPLNVRAWFLAGASLLKQGQHERAAWLLNDVLQRVQQEVAGLAYLLSLSLHELGRADEAKQWLGLVARDQKLWDSLGDETNFDLVLKRIIAAGHGDVAYA